MNNKVLTISDDQNEMRVFVNTHEKVVLSLNEDSEYSTCIELDKEDVFVLISELKKLSKEL